MTLNLRNVNQLQEYVMIQTNETYDDGQVSYLESRFSKELLMSLIKKSAFKDITLYSMMTRGMITANDLINDKVNEPSIAVSNENSLLTFNKNDQVDAEDKIMAK